MNLIWLLLLLLLLLLSSSPINAQQNNPLRSCESESESKKQKGIPRSCRAFLIFQSKSPYNSVSSISNLTSSNQKDLARINNVAISTVFPADMQVIVPLNCSCEDGRFYQSNATYVLRPQDTYYVVASGVYQGFTSWESIESANEFDGNDLRPGVKLQVPLVCACPTRFQAGNGVKYLLAYSVGNGTNVSEIGMRFNVSKKSILEANGFNGENQNLNPSHFSKILIPLSTEPAISLINSPSPHSLVKEEKIRNVSVDIATKTGFFLLAFGFIVFSIFLLCQTRRNRTPQNSNRVLKRWVPPADLRAEIANLERVVKVFNFDELMTATKRFSRKNRISGSVYRGTFEKKIILAVKRIRADQATKEVDLLKKVYHFNLVKLEGVCENHGRFYFLSEYMENGSLREWLTRGSSGEKRLSWNKRVQIALDVANGLHYLHSFTWPAYVHNNINSNNILLDTNLRAKISNFSLARTTDRSEQNFVLTNDVVGAKGYMAPEYREVGLLTPKIDVYAFGVVVLELITGKEAVFTEGGREVLLSAAMANSREDGLAQFVDFTIKENGGMEFAFLMAKLGIACLIQEPERRPTMAEVVSNLVKILAHLQKPESIYNKQEERTESSETDTDVEL